MDENDDRSERREDFLGVSFAKIEDVYRRAVREALISYKNLGNSVAISRNGKVVILGRDEIPVEEISEDEVEA